MKAPFDVNRFHVVEHADAAAQKADAGLCLSQGPAPNLPSQFAARPGKRTARLYQGFFDESRNMTSSLIP
jgi:hypothetical protein